MSTKSSGSSRGGRNKSKQKARGQVQGNSKPKDAVQLNDPNSVSEGIDGNRHQQRQSTGHSTDTSNNGRGVNSPEGRPTNTGPKTATRRKFMREVPPSTSADNPRGKVQEHTMPPLQFDGVPDEAEEGPQISGLGRKGVRKNDLVSFYELESTKNSKDSWRRLPEVPSVEELLRERVDLPINIIDAPYDSVDDYLEAHYELLREDAFAGLREAVGYMRQHPKTDDTQEIAIYDHVRLLGLTFAPIGVCCKVSFSLNRAGKKISWGNSKRLIPGTLVCLSDDDFQTLRVATVAARPMAGLALDPPEVDLLFNDDSDIEIDSSKTFVMVESRQGYFEAYKWTLKALQRINESNFLLADHLCFLNKNVPPPDYLKEKPTLNLSTIFPDSNDKEALEEVNVLKPWPEKVSTTMDKSQLSALKTILTNRVAIVQGPPGTGKTWVSVLALRAMLRNMDKGDPPIIVACQTNHALDQLLNKILEHESDVVRLGGRTQDREKILERTIYELASNSKVQIIGSQLSRSRMLKEILISKMVELLRILSQELLTPEDLSAYGVITPDQEESFFSSREGWVTFKDDEQNSGVMADWLGDYFEPILVPGNMYDEYEEGEIEYERIKEIEAEFQSGGANNDFDDTLRGSWLPMSRQFCVRQPIGVSDDDLRQALKASNVWDLGEHLRAAMYHHLKAKVLEKIRHSLGGMIREYQGHVTQTKIARLEKYAHIAGSCKLVGLTTTGLSKYRSLLAALKPKVLLIEEAAETLEGLVTAGCMPTVEHLILVGDHKQLRGHCSVRELAGDPFFLEISMFERLVSNKIPFVTLRTQRRMRPEIREILRPIYHDMLKDHKTVLGRPGVPGMGKNHVYWYSHTNPERKDEGTSRINVEEAAMIVGFVEYLVLNKTPSEKITILTFYGGQKSEILKGVRRNNNLKQTNVKVTTVDSYQGEENDVIILSLVRSNETGSVGFLNVANRVCVALSRAMLGFYIFGNAQMITKADKIWWEVGKILNLSPTRIGFSMPIVCQKHGKTERIKESHDWIDVAGGCYQWCKETLPCKHTCHFRCHPFDHSEIRCIEKCARRLLCNHPCLEDCYETCICRKCANRESSGESLNITSPPGMNLQKDMESFSNDTRGPTRDTRTELMARGVGFNNYDQRGRAGFARGAPAAAKNRWGETEYGNSQDSRTNTKKARGVESSGPATPRGNPTPKRAIAAATGQRGPQDMRLSGGTGRNPSSYAGAASVGRGRDLNGNTSQPTTAMSWSTVASIGQQPAQGSQGRFGGPSGPGGGYARR